MTPSALHIHFWADIRNTAGSVEKVITAFASHGCRYHHLIACCPTEKNIPKTFTYHGVQVHTFREHHVKNRFFNKILRMGVFTYPDLVRLIDQHRPEILHFHNRQELIDAVVSRLSYRPGIVVHYHRHFANPVIPIFAERLICVSQRTREYLLEKTGTKLPVTVLYNPLSDELLSAAADCTSDEVPGKPPTILFGGGASPIKGGAALIEAFQRLPHGRARLILAGNGVESLPGLPYPGIEVMGRLPAQEFLALMRACNIVAMPSVDEAFGLVAQEAMALGRLLLVSGTGGLTEFTGPDCAVVVQPQDVDSIEVGIRQALDLLEPASRARRALLLGLAKKRLQAFAPQTLTMQLESCYDEVIELHPGRTDTIGLDESRLSPQAQSE